jgi:predicted PurR-regulated permease PerM
MMNQLPMGDRWSQWIMGTAVIVLVFVGTFVILRPFWVPVAWAVVLAVVTWPVFLRIRSALGEREGLAALAMTLLLIVAIVAPVVVLTITLVQEARSAYQTIQLWILQGPPALPAWLIDLPFVGETIRQWHDYFTQDPDRLRDFIEKYQKQWTSNILATGREIGIALAKIALTILTAFFIYRYGESLALQTRHVFNRLAGEGVSRFLHPIGETIKAVVYGLLLTALVQGILAGIGYWAAGLDSPVLLGAATAFLALLPFGAPLIWVPSAIYLLSEGSMVQGIGLILWGALVISWIDNLLRPLFISGSTKIPFLLVLFGLAGGLLAFGMIGLLLGPVILSVILTLWEEWAQKSERVIGAKRTEKQTL